MQQTGQERMELDLQRYELRRGGQVLRLEKIPMELLIFLVENRGQLVKRDAIIERLWGKDVFLDTEQGINTAIRKIRQTLRDDTDQPRYLETVVGKGYRFVGPIEVVPSVPSPSSNSGVAPTIAGPAVVPPSSVSKHPTGTSRRRWLPLVAVLSVLSLALVAWYYGRRPGFGRPAIHAVAVIPLKNLSGNPADEYFADGMTDELVTNLAKISSLRVTSYTSIAKYKNTTAPLPEIARNLNVDAIVEGSVVRSGDQVRITAQLIYAQRDQHLWAEEYQRNLRDVLSLQREVARDIALQVRATLTPNEVSRLSNANVVDPVAYEAYLRGRSFWNQRSQASLRKAIDQFNAAIERDPSYAPAYAGLADAYNIMGYLSYLDPVDAFPRAHEAALKAVALDPDLAEAHVSLAYFNLYHAWNFPAAETEFQRAIDLNPNYSTAHEMYSYFLLAVGRMDEARARIERAQQLDPLSVAISTDVGFNFFYRRDYDGAITQLRQTLAINPKFPLAHLWLGRAYQQKKMFPEAIDEFSKTESAIPGWIVTLAGIGNVYGEWGKNDEARQVLDRLDQLSRQQYVTPYGVALVHAGMGDKEKAFAWLDKAYQGRNHWLVWLNRDPRWDRLRSDPRFADLVKRVGLPPS